MMGGDTVPGGYNMIGDDTVTGGYRRLHYDRW